MYSVNSIRTLSLPQNRQTISTLYFIEFYVRDISLMKPEKDFFIPPILMAEII